jgi:hypothetical protein
MEIEQTYMSPSVSKREEMANAKPVVGRKSVSDGASVVLANSLACVSNVARSPGSYENQSVSRGDRYKRERIFTISRADAVGIVWVAQAS